MLNKLAAAKARAPAQQREYDCQFIPNFACQLIIGCNKEKYGFYNAVAFWPLFGRLKRARWTVRDC
jgi:hypothetical protein